MLAKQRCQEFLIAAAAMKVAVSYGALCLLSDLCRLAVTLISA